MKKRIKNFSQIFSLLLFLGFGMSLGAPYGWQFDIFRNFVIQYAVLGVFLGIISLFLRSWLLAVPLFMISFFSIYQMYSVYSDPWVLSPPQTQSPNLTVVQFNKKFASKEWGVIENWMKTEAQHIDIMFIHESGSHTLYMLQKYKEYFPYQFPPRHEQRFNDISILSRFPFKAEEIPSLNIDGDMPGVKVTFQRPDMQQAVHLYSIHAQSALSHARHKERLEDLLIMKQAINADKSPYKIFLGDWNTTPYSPVFQRLLDDTGMKYNDYSWFPKVTWNYYFYLPFLKIPIDHMIYTPQIQQISKEVGPSLGSDHHMLIAKFHIPES